MQPVAFHRAVRAALLGLLAPIALVVRAPAAAAQGSMLAPDSTLSSCLAARSSARWPAREIYVYAELADSLQREYLSSAGAVANVVGLMARTAYGADDSVVAAEPALSWRATQAAVRVKAYRDGRLTWSHDRAPSAAVEAGPELIRQALDALVATHVGVPWPLALVGDSVQFRLFLGVGDARERTADEAYRFAQSNWPVFTLRMPPIQPLVDRDGPRSARPGAYRVRVEWVVDSTSRALPTSFRLVGADDVDEMPDADAAAFREFLASARAQVARRRYRAARIDGCAAAMTASDEFDYLVR